MLWDNNCSDSCSFPFVPRIDGQAKFCDSPCVKGSNEQLFWNGSCHLICPFFPRSQNGYKLCDACQPNYFMFPNTTCLASCPFPYQNRSMGGSNFCDFPCKEDARFFFEKKQICKSTCEYPYNVHETIFCYLEVAKEEAKQLEAIKGAVSLANTAITFLGAMISMVTVNPAAIFACLFVDMLGYIKYIDIKYPPSLQYYFDIKIDLPFAVLSNAPPQLTSLITKYVLPGKFGEDEDLHSSFFINFWSKILVLLPLMLAIGIFYCMNAKCRAFKSFFKKIDHKLRWNLPVTLFVSYYKEIVLFASFEFTTMNLTSTPHILSFFICSIFNFLLIASFLQLVHVILLNWKVRANTKNHEHDNDLRNASRLLLQYQVVFEDSKTASISQQAFFCIFACRTIIFTTTLAYLQEDPLAQAILITTLSFGMLLYLGITRPTKSRIDLGMYIIQELIMLTAKTCILILSVFDSREIQNYNTRETLGKIILNCFIAFGVTALLYSVIQSFSFLYDAYKVFINFLTKKGISQKEKIVLHLEQESIDQTNSINVSMEHSKIVKIPNPVNSPKTKEKIDESIEIEPFQSIKKKTEKTYFEPKVLRRNLSISKKGVEFVKSSLQNFNAVNRRPEAKKN